MDHRSIFVAIGEMSNSSYHFLAHESPTYNTSLIVPHWYGPVARVRWFHLIGSRLDWVIDIERRTINLDRSVFDENEKRPTS